MIKILCYKIFVTIKKGQLEEAIINFRTLTFYVLKEDPPECTACQESYSVTHVLIHCIDLGLTWPRLYTIQDIESVSVDRILSFCKEVNLFAKI